MFCFSCCSLRFLKKENPPHLSARRDAISYAVPPYFRSLSHGLDTFMAFNAAGRAGLAPLGDGFQYAPVGTFSASVPLCTQVMRPTLLVIVLQSYLNTAALPLQHQFCLKLRRTGGQPVPHKRFGRSPCSYSSQAIMSPLSQSLCVKLNHPLTEMFRIMVYQEILF